MRTPLHRRLVILLVAAFAAVLLADLAVWGVPSPGLGWVVADAGLLALALLVRSSAVSTTAGRWSLVIAASAIGGLAIDPGPLGLLIAPCACLALAAGCREGVAAAVLPSLGRICLGGPRLVLDSVIVARVADRRPRRCGLAWVLRWLGPLAIAGIFLALFALGNPVIGLHLGQVGDWLAKLDLPPVDRIAWWIALFAVAWAVVRPFRWRVPRAARVVVEPLADNAAGVVRCLVAANAVFLVQLASDACYLTGGVALPDGMTYAEYAHRGAYLLVATALLAAAFVLRWFRPGAGAEHDPWARRLLGLWMAQNVLLLVAALWRLDLYIDAYGLTRWRIAAALWMALVATGLVLCAWRVWRHHANRWLVEMNARAVLAVLLFAAAAPWSPVIAWYNVSHCREIGGRGPSIDWGYLRELGPTAGPAAAWLVRNSRDPATAATAAPWVAQYEQLLDRYASDLRTWTLTIWLASR